MMMTMPELKVAKLVFGLLGWAELRPKCNPLRVSTTSITTMMMILILIDVFDDLDDFNSDDDFDDFNSDLYRVHSNQQ